MGTGLEIAALALTAVGTVQSARASSKQRKAQKASLAEQRKAREAELRQQRLRQARERREFIRQSRIRAAQVLASAEGQGAAESSAAAGGQASLRSRTASGLQFLNASESLANEAIQRTLNAEQFLGQANIFAGQAQTGAAIADLGANIFSNAEQINSLFSSGGSGGVTVNGGISATSPFSNVSGFKV